MLRRKGIQKKMMDFDYCEEYLTNISNKILLRQSSKFSSPWHLEIDEKSIMEKNIKKTDSNFNVF